MAQSTTNDERWERLIDVAAEFGLRHPDAVLVGGTVAALYAGHRVSLDADFILTDLRERFEQLLTALETDPDWVTARLNPPVLILGQFKGVETGLRQLRRDRALESTEIGLRGQRLRVPTLCEILRIKGWLAGEPDLPVLAGGKHPVDHAAAKMNSRCEDSVSAALCSNVLPLLDGASEPSAPRITVLSFHGTNFRLRPWTPLPYATCVSEPAS